jgi:predicted aminopeptidase
MRRERQNIMAKFMCTHTIPPGAFTADQIRQFAEAAQQDPDVKGYRSFANLAEGKAVCVMEASSKEEVAAWFTKMGMPFDSITNVELEGERGTIHLA